MKLQFRRQKFQEEAVRAVVDVFTGCPNTGMPPQFAHDKILERLHKIQKKNGIAPSKSLEGRYNLTVEMETGTGKTYTYIKTIFELNRQYGWSKFMVVVPSIAIREGVYKSFQMLQEHFAEEYGTRLRYFIYNSCQLNEVERFHSDNNLHVMIINSQAFSAKGKDARRIYMKLDEFQSRRPIDVIASANPVVIIDEPQSVEGKQTRKNLEAFHPWLTLRYSATFKPDNIYNMVYRLDAVEAYKKRLVKKIAVKGIAKADGEASNAYLYLESIEVLKGVPAARIEFDFCSPHGVCRKTQKAGVGFDLYLNSGKDEKLEIYREGFVITSIHAGENYLEFANGCKLRAGEVRGCVDQEQIWRLQIRETILSHFEREKQLFSKGIKVLSLFFIDEVAHYRTYDEAGLPQKGMFAGMFEEEYKDIAGRVQDETQDEAYRGYLEKISPEKTHDGYFSIDRRGCMVNQTAGDDRKNQVSNDASAYELILKDKERLLELDAEKSPVRFIFSHSALREGWDNPNIFQICTLKQSSSAIRKRQEVGRGLRLCVNQQGIRMDADVLGAKVHRINVLTVIASESYEDFARGLQSELAEEAADRSPSEFCILQPQDARRKHLEPQAVQEDAENGGYLHKPLRMADLDTGEWLAKCIASLNGRLHISKRNHNAAVRDFKYDLLGSLAEKTRLTRKMVMQILIGIDPTVFEQFRDYPEEFINKAADLIVEQMSII
ncbi:DEAD/DEAH box helicase [Lachnospiraceae bacterium]|nr:DEAD/DEAH box helicase [Lachnospiraceae bacterium]